MTIFGLPLAHSQFSFEKEGMFLSEKKRVFQDLVQMAEARGDVAIQEATKKQYLENWDKEKKNPQAPKISELNIQNIPDALKGKNLDQLTGDEAWQLRRSVGKVSLSDALAQFNKGKEYSLADWKDSINKAVAQLQPNASPQLKATIEQIAKTLLFKESAPRGNPFSMNQWGPCGGFQMTEGTAKGTEDFIRGQENPPSIPNGLNPFNIEQASLLGVGHILQLMSNPAIGNNIPKLLSFYNQGTDNPSTALRPEEGIAYIRDGMGLLEIAKQGNSNIQFESLEGVEVTIVETKQKQRVTRVRSQPTDYGQIFLDTQKLILPTLETNRNLVSFSDKTARLQEIQEKIKTLSTTFDNAMKASANDYDRANFNGAPFEVDTHIANLLSQKNFPLVQPLPLEIVLTKPATSVSLGSLPTNDVSQKNSAENILRPYKLSIDNKENLTRTLQSLMQASSDVNDFNKRASAELSQGLANIRETQIRETFKGFSLKIKVDTVPNSITAQFYGENRIDTKKYQTVESTLKTLRESTDKKPLDRNTLIELFAHLKESLNINPQDIIQGKGKLKIPSSQGDNDKFQQTVLAQNLLNKIDFSNINWDKDFSNNSLLENASYQGHKSISEHYQDSIETPSELLKFTIDIAQALGMEKPNEGSFTKEEIATFLQRFIVKDEKGNLSLTAEAQQALTDYQANKANIEKLKNDVAANSLNNESNINAFNPQQLAKISQSIVTLLHMLGGNENGDVIPDSQDPRQKMINRLILRYHAVNKVKSATESLKTHNDTLERMKIKGDFTIDRIQALMKVEADKQGKESFVKYIPAVIAEWWHGMDVDSINSNQNFHQKTMDLLSVAALQVRKERDAGIFKTQAKAEIENKKKEDPTLTEDTLAQKLFDTRLSEVSAQLFDAYNSFFVDPEKFERFVEPALIQAQVNNGKTQEQAKIDTKNWYANIAGKIGDTFSWFTTPFSSLINGESASTKMVENPKAGQGTDDFKKIMGAFIGQADALKQFKDGVCVYGQNGINPNELAGLLTKEKYGIDQTFADQAEKIRATMLQQGEKGKDALRYLLDGNVSNSFVTGLNQQMREARPRIAIGGNEKLAEAYKAYQENLQSGGVAQWWDGMSGGLKLGLIALLGLAAFKNPETFVKGGLGMFGAMALTKAKTPGELVDIVTSKASRGIDRVATAMGLTKDSEWNRVQERLRPDMQERKALTLVERLPLQDITDTLQQGDVKQLATGNFPAESLNKLLESGIKQAGITNTLGISTTDLSKALYKVLVARAAQQQDITAKGSNFVEEGFQFMKRDLDGYKLNGGRAGTTFEQWIASHVTRYDSLSQDTVMYATALAEFGVDKGSQFGQWLGENYEEGKTKIEKISKKVGDWAWDQFQVYDEKTKETKWFFKVTSGPNGNLLDDISAITSAAGDTKFYQGGKEIAFYLLAEPVQEMLLYTGLATDRAWQPKEIAEIRRNPNRKLFDNDKVNGEAKRTQFAEYIRAVNKILAPLGNKIENADEDFNNWMLGADEAASNLTTGNAGSFEDNRALQLFKGVKQGIIYRIFQDLNDPTATVKPMGQTEIENDVKERLKDPNYSSIKERLWGLWQSKIPQAETVSNLMDLLNNKGWLSWFNNLDEEDNAKVMKELATLGAKKEVKAHVEQFNTELAERFAKDYDLWGPDKTEGGERIYAQTIFLFQELMNGADKASAQDRDDYAKYIKEQIFKFYRTKLYDKTPTSWHVNELRSGVNGNGLPDFKKWKNDDAPKASASAGPATGATALVEIVEMRTEKVNKIKTEIDKVLADTNLDDTKKTEAIVKLLQTQTDKTLVADVFAQSDDKTLMLITNIQEGRDLVREVSKLKGPIKVIERFELARKNFILALVGDYLDKRQYPDIASFTEKEMDEFALQLYEKTNATPQQIDRTLHKFIPDLQVTAEEIVSTTPQEELKKERYKKHVLEELQK